MPSFEQRVLRKFWMYCLRCVVEEVYKYMYSRRVGKVLGAGEHIS